MRRVMAGQQSLSNFYESVKFDNPALAAEMYNDVATVAMYGISADATGGQEAADRLREQARDLPEIQRRVLEYALEDLGFT